MTEFVQSKEFFRVDFLIQAPKHRRTGSYDHEKCEEWLDTNNLKVFDLSFGEIMNIYRNC